MSRYPTLEALNAAGIAQRDRIVATLSEAGRPLLREPKWALAAGGWLRDCDGDLDAALNRAADAGAYQAVEVLATYAAALRDIAAVSTVRAA